MTPSIQGSPVRRALDGLLWGSQFASAPVIAADSPLSGAEPEGAAYDHRRGGRSRHGIRRGIGRAIALRLARDGAHIAVVDLDDANTAAVAKELQGVRRRATMFKAGVTNCYDAGQAPLIDGGLVYR